MMSCKSSSDDDEQGEFNGDNNIYDQLKSFKPLPVNQLLNLHPDVGCPTLTTDYYIDCNTLETKSTITTTTTTTSSSYHDQELYQNLIDYEQLKNKLFKLKAQIKILNRKTFDNIDKVWSFHEEAPRKIGMCQQGKIAETTLKYKQATLNTKQLNNFDLSFNELIDSISKDYIYYSFESQMKKNKIATQLSTTYTVEELEIRRVKLKSAIGTLIDFIKHLGDLKSDFILQCRKWLRALVKRFLETESIDDYKFIIAQLCKGPSGTADWSSDLIEYKPSIFSDQFEASPKYISHCSALLSELFKNLKTKIRRVTISNTIDVNTTDQQEQNWSLLDPRFNCSEELSASSANNTLSENDVIKFCLRLPVAEIFKTYVKKCLESNGAHLENDNYQNIMLKLLAIGTVIIRTYQIGLESFNSIQYGNLIEYLSSQIKRTVIVLSDQWAEFKRRLKGIDNALLMRLQVEYDNFILRSILIILELRQSGIWRHLSNIEPEDLINIDCANSWSAESIRPTLTRLLQATGLANSSATTTASAPTIAFESEKIATRTKSANSLTYEFSIEWFNEVSEPMLWHILWQFYHNAFVSSCDYHSDNYWLEKFQEKSVVYLFVNKIRDSSLGECSYLLNSVTSMILSRTKAELKFVAFVATELFNLSFRHKELREKITSKGIRSLIRCAEKFPSLLSLYLSFLNYVDSDDDDIVTLFKGCSISGWLCNEEEFNLIGSWLIENPLNSAHNKVSRILISKLLLNSSYNDHSNLGDISRASTASRRSKGDTKQRFVDLRLRRRFALLLYEASVRHLPENTDYKPLSFGASVEVAFGTLFCEKSSTSMINLIGLATDANYQQFYVWIWRLLFTFKLHILNQPETDWNDVQSRSGTSRSIKNTVLFDDSFHPAPTIQDSECLVLAEGVENQNPMALFIYLSMTDITWQPDTLENCFGYLNTMANSGHLTPSLMAMKYLTICHLNNLSETIAKDSRCLEYFTTIINSDFDSNRLASLIICQLQNLKQYRQLQLSQFYIKVLLEVTPLVLKQLSSQWFSGGEYKLEKIACLLDFIVKFNFPTQRLEIVRKFYECSYSIQGCKTSNGWLGSLFATNSLNTHSTKREFVTTAHILAQKFKKFSWLRWVITECDTLRLEKIWEDIVLFLSTNEGSNLEAALKKVCPQLNPTILKATLPIYSWIEQILDIVETDLSHPLCPLIWYNFYLNYFANSLNGVSVGIKLVPIETQTKLLSRLDSLINYHLYKHRNWLSASNLKQNSLAQLYRAYRLWLQDVTLQDAYVDMDRLRDDYLVSLLKAIMESSTEDSCLQFIDFSIIETQNRNLAQIWSTAILLEGNVSLKDMIFVSNANNSIEILTSVENDANDATSLNSTQPLLTNQTDHKKLMASSEEELKVLLSNKGQRYHESFNDTIMLIQNNCQDIIEESTMFGNNMQELERLKVEISELLQQLYVNKKREHVRVVSCSDGNECIGPARIKFEVEEATIDDRKSECIQDRQRQCDELVEEMIIMPSNNIVKSAILIEDCLRHVIEKPENTKNLIESLLNWISDNSIYERLNLSYYAANHLLKAILDILSNTNEVDTYNTSLIDVCFRHPADVQIFSPYLFPSACEAKCFLDLYKKVSEAHETLGPTALFVLLSKFDVNSWLTANKSKEMLHDMIKTTCSALNHMGKQPDESFVLTFDLYKRHIQIELALPDRRKPEEILLVLSQFLDFMDQQTLWPPLWVEFMTILGLEKRVFLINKNNIKTKSSNKSNKRLSQSHSSSFCEPQSIGTNSSSVDNKRIDSSFAIVIEDVARLADSQTILDYQMLDNMMTTIGQFVKTKEASERVTLLELYCDYLEQFGTVIASITFLWLKVVGETYPDNHELIWRKFSDIWYKWVFITKNCQSVAIESYSLIANQFVASIGYMINRIPDNTQKILRSVLWDLANYVQTTKEVVYLELTFLQRCLKNLPWSTLLASAEDFENLAILSEQENYNLSDLTSHILMQIDTKNSLAYINETNSSIIPRIVERLAVIIALQSNHLRGFRLSGGYYAMIPVESINNIATLILPRMEFANLEHSQSNKLLVNLMRFMCIKFDELQQTNLVDSFERSIIYAKFVSNYLVTLIKNYPSVVRYHKPYIYAVMDNSLSDLKILLSPDVEISRKIVLYENLLECCSSTLIDEASRMLIARSLIKSSNLKNRPIVVMEVFHSIGRIISDAKVLVYTIEKMISIYLNMDGHYEKVWKSFNLKILPSDIYLEACIEERYPLALLVYFESLSHDGQDDQSRSDASSINDASALGNIRVWSSFFHWISQLSVLSYVNKSNEIKSNDIRLAIAWIRLLDLLEPDLNQFVHHEIPINKRSSGSNDDTDDKSRSHERTVKENDNQQQPVLAKSNRIQQVGNSLQPCHKALVEFIKRLISIFDACNSSGLWSYLKFSKSEQTSRISIIALSVACFLSDRTLNCLSSTSASTSKEDSVSNNTEDPKQRKNSLASHLLVLQDEVSKLKKSCLQKLDLARKSKNYLDNVQYIETLIESVNQNDKVQYSDGVQLLTTFVRNIDSSMESDDSVCINKILTSFSD